MPTPAGVAVAVLGVATVVAGRVIGAIELYVIGSVLVALTLVALVYVRTAKLRVEMAREVHPTRVHAGQTTRVELRATNRGRARTPMLRLSDPVEGTQGARLRLAPLARGEIARAAYRLPTNHRGIVGVGPLRVRIGDPFQLAQLTLTAAPFAEIIVLPHLDDIVAVEGTGGHDPHAGTEHSTSLGRQGEDFHSLRPYVIGDDLRRVHWPSSARQDDLMVRTDEIPWQGRCTVVLDVRAMSHDELSFEMAVSAAASVINAAWSARDVVRFVTTDGRDITTSGPHEGLLEHLATIDVSNTGSMRQVVSALSRGGTGGALVMVLGRATHADLDGLARLERRFSSTTIVTCRADGAVPGTRRRLTTIALDENIRFVEAWGDAHGRRRAVTMGTR